MGREIMATPGGVGEFSPVPSQPVRHPVVEADAALAATLLEKAEGVSYLPDLPQLGLIDIGDGKGEVYPLRVPLLGHGSILLGDGPPKPVQPTVVGRDVPRTEMRQAIVRAKVADDMERLRRGEAFVADGKAAIGVSTALIAQALERIPHGSLVVRTCCMIGNGEAFAPLKALGRYYQPMNEGGLLPTLQALTALVGTRQKDLTSKNHASLLSAMAAGETNRTWQIVVIIGDHGLSYKAQEQLEKLLQEGPAMGVSLIVSGYDLQAGGRTTRISKLRHQYAQVSYAPWAPVTLDEPPKSAQLLQLARAKNAATVSATAAPKTGAAYARALKSQKQEQDSARQEAAIVAQKFPILEGANLAEVIGPSHEIYAKTIDAIARSADPYATAQAALREVLAKGKKTSDPQRAADIAMALAGVDLALSAGYSHGLMPAKNLQGAIKKYLTTYIAKLEPLITITRNQGIDRLPPKMREYTAQFLGDHPPAWAMQLLARIGSVSQPAREIVASRLQQVFDPERKLTGEMHKPTVHDAVLELYLLGLLRADDSATSFELRTLLDKRAAPRMNAVTRNELPPLSHDLYDSFQARARAEREQRRRQAAAGLGSVASTDGDGFTLPGAPYYVAK